MAPFPRNGPKDFKPLESIHLPAAQGGGFIHHGALRLSGSRHMPMSRNWSSLRCFSLRKAC
jgi:hypothetical protein